MNIDVLKETIETADPYKRFGKVNRVVGLMIESKGPESSIGDVCLIHKKGRKHDPIKAEVVGFRDEHILLMPYVEASNISPGSLVEATGESLKVKVGTGLIGEVVDAFGEPLDGSMLPKGLAPVSTDQSPPNPMDRPPIREKMGVGVRVIDSLLTVGTGQRIGIFAGVVLEKVP